MPRFIDQPEVVEKILQHLRLWRPRSRDPPEATAAAEPDGWFPTTPRTLSGVVRITPLRLETGPPRGTLTREIETAARAEAIRANGKKATPRGRYQWRVGLSSGIPRAPERARGRAGQTGALALATQASDRGWGGHQRQVRTTTRGVGQPPDPRRGRAALGGWARRRAGLGGRGSAGPPLAARSRR